MSSKKSRRIRRRALTDAVLEQWDARAHSMCICGHLGKHHETSTAMECSDRDECGCVAFRETPAASEKES